MDWMKLDNILDEAVSQLMDTIKKHNLEPHESDMIMNAIERAVDMGALRRLWELDAFEKDTPWYADMKREIFEHEINM